MDELLTLSDFSSMSNAKLPKQIKDYINGGAYNEETIKENLNALKRYKIRPRVMRNVSNRSLKTKIIGNDVSMPIGICPMFAHSACHKEGELATVTAASAFPIITTIGMMSSVRIETLMSKCPSSILFQQVFISKPKSYTENVVRNAEKCNLKGIVVTLDQPQFPIKLRDRRNKLNLSEYIELGNKELDRIYKKDRFQVYDILFNSAQTWEDVSWLKSITSLPVIVKGIMRSDDAIEAINCGVDAIWVSNHGGRQLDSCSATIDVLAEVVKAVNGRCEIYIDGGFRSGLDVFKALALGATAIFIGRPIMHGLACYGEAGVKRVLDILRNELDNTMALAGCSSVKDITPSHVTQNQWKCKL